MTSVLQWITDHLIYIGFAVSELLVFIPSVKSNSVVQLVVNSVKAIVDTLANAFGSTPPSSLPPSPQVK